MSSLEWLKFNKYMFNKRSGLIALLVCFAAGELRAGTIANYTVGDVLICFRKNGGANNLVVDAGPVSTFTNATPNQRISITQYTGSQLALVGTNAVSWSAFTWFDDSVSPASAQWTLFVSKARTFLNTQTSPWAAKSALAQQLPAGDMSTVAVGANDNLNFNGLNTSTAVIEQDSSAGNPNYPNGQSYHTAIDPYGTGDFDFGGDFDGDPEITTPANFTASGMVVRSDFYQIPPTGSGVVKFLGYFEFNTNGVMTYVAYPSVAVVAPTIISIVRTGTTNTITFTTGPTGTYTLCGTNNLVVPRTNWPAVSAISGNSGQRSLTDVDNNGSKFYIITAQ
jgi:hypothetical protein